MDTDTQVPPKSHSNTKIMIGDPQNIFGMCDGPVFWVIGGVYVANIYATINLEYYRTIHNNQP